MVSKAASGGSIGITDVIGGLGSLIASTLGGLATECLEVGLPWIKLISIAVFSIKGMLDLYECHRAYNECLPPPPELLETNFLGSFDPNEMIGPKGYGGEAFVPLREPLLYRINFENLSSATAAAQLIRITDNLPPGLDIRTVRLKEIGFKQDRIVVPDNQAFFQQRIQLGADLNNLKADILAGVDLVGNQIFWSLQAIDPQTGEAPLDPFAGLLPPNDANQDGEGYVIFTVEARSTFPNRTVINNLATIVFDQNEPIVTNTVTNLLDSVVPTSQIAPLPPTFAAPDFDLSWTKSDDTDGSGYAGTGLMFSEDGGPYTLYANNPSATTATFIGRWGKAHRFYSLGRDNAGDNEMPPSVPDATTTTLGGDTEADLAPRANGNDGLLLADDTNQVRRFVAGLDTDFTYKEFQRSDMSPREGGGNGTLSVVADVMQARRFVALLDPKADASGPNEVSGFSPRTIAGKGSDLLPRELHVERLTHVGNQINVGIRLEAQGDETGAGFTLNFDPAVLSNPVVTLGSDATGAALTVNASQAATGKLGIMIDKAPAAPLAGGTRLMATIIFNVAVGAPASTQINFGNATVVAEVVNGLANSLTTTFSTGTISLLGPTAAGVSVSGTVFRSNGVPLKNARLTLSESAGHPRFALTTAFGHFRFDDVAAGQTYTVDVRGKGYVFALRLITVSEETIGLKFSPEP